MPQCNREDFIDNVLAEVFELFPSKYIHVGGDEVPTKTWSECAKCQARKEAEHLRGLLGQGLTQIKNAERHAKIEEMARLSDAYLQAFDRIETSARIVAKLNATDLPAAGAAMAGTMSELIADATKADNAEFAAVANQTDRLMLLNFFYRGRARQDSRKHLLLANSPRDQLRVLSAEIQHDYSPSSAHLTSGLLLNRT